VFVHPRLIFSGKAGTAPMELYPNGRFRAMTGSANTLAYYDILTLAIKRFLL